jgi:cysteinyl-tRNA synthetase
MKIHNTLTQTKEEFTPIEPDHVRMYVCGPTVYDFLHVGNFRGPIFFNFVRNYFEHQGKKVTYVYNYTDVDDKIIKRANDLKITPFELADQFVMEFEKDFKSVGLRPATFNPRVTHHIKEIIAMIEKIILHGSAYVVEGEVYCSIEKIKDYGKLSHKNIDELIAGARVAMGEKKKNPLDFSLWKPAKAGEPFWDSPWGKGRPGWHIECSAMSKKYLGDTFDIHGGGIDLIFPHHENEMAQSESANNKPFVKVWMHNNFINMGKEKMSKSLGNIFKARQFLEKYNGEILKYLLLSAHYRSASDFGATVIQNSLAGLARIYSSLAQAESWLKKCEDSQIVANPKGPVLDPKGFGEKVSSIWDLVHKACDDDFNTPEVMAEIFNIVRSFNAVLKAGLKPSQELANSCEQFLSRVKAIGALLALFQNPPKSFLIELDDMLLNEKGLKRSEIQSIVDDRYAARRNKDFKTADEIRGKLLQLGIELRDSPEGTEWEEKKN